MDGAYSDQAGVLVNMPRERRKIRGFFAEIIKNDFRYCILWKSRVCYRK